MIRCFTPDKVGFSSSVSSNVRAAITCGHREAFIVFYVWNGMALVFQWIIFKTDWLVLGGSRQTPTLAAFVGVTLDP